MTKVMFFLFIVISTFLTSKPWKVIRIKVNLDRERFRISAMDTAIHLNKTGVHALNHQRTTSDFSYLMCKLNIVVFP